MQTKQNTMTQLLYILAYCTALILVGGFEAGIIDIERLKHRFMIRLFAWIFLSLAILSFFGICSGALHQFFILLMTGFMSWICFSIHPKKIEQ